jgi:hypothetical protein
MMDPQQADWAEQARWRKDRDDRLAERQAEQERRHEADPFNVPKYLPADDDEFPDESYTAGWIDEE